MTNDPEKPERGRLVAARVPKGALGLHPPEESSAPENMRLINPVASDEALVESFRRYQALKEKLLDESDYTWFCVYKLTDKTKREGFPKREDAEAKIKAFRDGGIPAELEKKVKKSGVYKLSKAFGISTAVIEKDVNRDKGYAFYLVRATAPNGQSRERGGLCDRQEKGRHDGPFDHIDAIALTRAEDRAIMALLGGENTAEEFVDEPLVVPDGPPTAQEPSRATQEHRTSLLAALVAAAKDAGVTEEQLNAKIVETTGAKSWQDMAEPDIIAATDALKAKAKIHEHQSATETAKTEEALPDYGDKDWSKEGPLAPKETEDAEIAETARKAVEASKSPPKPLPPKAQASVNAIDEKFSGAKPAKPVDKQVLLGRMFAAIGEAGLDPENVKREIRRVYGIESSKDMTVEQILEVTGFIESKKGDRV